MRHYIALVHKDATSDFGVSFPDFPGAVTAAATSDKAIEQAEEALALHVEGMLEDGETIPEPSNLDQIKASANFRDALPVLVPLRTDALAMRVNVTLPATILRRIDTYVEREGLTRSGFLADAAQHELTRALRSLHELRVYPAITELRASSKKGTKKLKVGSMAPVQVHRSGELVGRRAKKKAAPIAKRAAKGAKPRRAR